MRPERRARRGAPWVAGAAALLLAALLYWLFVRPPAQEATSGGPPDATAGIPGALAPPPPTDKNIKEARAATNPVALWRPIDEASVAELPAYKEVVQDRALVRVLDIAGDWQAGQRIAVPIPQLNEIYTPVIERIRRGFSGTRSYIGTLIEDAGRAHRFTITTGPRNTFAHLSTPHGVYELVATGELGWLMPAVHMDRHVDYSEPDYILPDPPPALER